MKKAFKIFIRILAWLIMALFVLLLVTAIVSQTDWFKTKLKEKAVTVANQALNATLHIGQIQGNLVTSLSLADVVLTQNEDTLAVIPNLAIRFKPFELFDNIIAFDVIRIDSAQFHIRQKADSTWNVSTIVPAREEPKEEKEKSTSVWKLYFDKVQLEAWSFRLKSALEPFWLPERVGDFNAVLSLSIEQGVNINLESMSMQALHPDLMIERLGLEMSIRNDTLDLDNLVMNLPRTRIKGRVNVPLGNPQSLSAMLRSSQLDLSELQPLLPFLPAQTLDTVAVDFQYQSTQHQAQVLITSGTQQIDLEGNLHAFTKFQGQIEFKNIDLETWMEDTLQNTNLNGNIEAMVQFDSLLAPGKLNLELTESSWQKQQLERLKLELNSDGKRADLGLDLSSEFGTADFVGRIDYHKPLRTFSLRGKLDHVDIQNLTQSSHLDSDVSLSIQAKGSFTDFTALQTEFSLKSQDIELAGFPIDTLAIGASWQQNELTLHSTRLRTPFAKLDLHGQVLQNLEHNVDLKLIVTDTLVFPQWMELDSIVVPMNLTAQVQGNAGSTFAELDARISSLHYNEIKSDSIYLSYEGQIDTLGIKGESRLWAKAIHTGSLIVDSLKITSQLDTVFYNQLSATIASQEKISTRFSVNPGPPIEIRIDSLYNEWKGIVWTTIGNPILLNLDPPEYRIENLMLASDKGQIRINAAIDLEGDVGADVDILDVDINRYSFLFEQFGSFQGRLNSKWQLAGSAAQPEFQGQTRIDSLRIGKTRIGDWTLENQYQDNLLKSSLIWDRGEQQLDLHSRLPIVLSFTEQDSNLLQPGGSITLETEEFNIAVLQFLAPQITALSGYMQADLEIRDPLKSPKPSGSFKIIDARVRIPSMGIAYNNINVTGVSEPNRFTLENLHIEAGSGALNATGNMNYEPALSSPKINLNLLIDNFLVMQSPRLQARLGGNISVGGTLNQPRYDGQLTVLRSRIDISKFATSAAPSAGDKPLLVQLQPAIEKRQAEARNTPALTNTIENLKGQIQIRIPRNTWIKSPDMSIEIRGSLEVIKNNTLFEIFGTIETIRGFYKIYGKRFRINEGTIQFQGGEEFNPLLDFVALYTFRSPDGIKKDLTIQIGGSLKEPNLAFQLEGQPIEERDAVSYLILGRPYDQLTLSQRSEMEDSGGPLGGGTLTNIIAGGFAGTLSSALQQQLNLDIIEFKGDQNWRQASVVVGKYITDDLFLSYERTLAFSRSTEVAPERVSMEYEVTPWLFLQATKGDEKSTGFDIIWKYRGYDNE